MGNLWIQVLPRSQHDLDVLNADFRPKAAADDAAGYEMMLRSDPLNIAYRNDVALLYLELSMPERAAAHFQIVAEMQSASASAHFNLGTALMQTPRVDEATRSLRRALELQGDYLRARVNLANLLAARGRLDEAEERSRIGLGLDPANAMLVNNLGQVLMLSGRLPEALQKFRDAARLDPAYADPHYNLGRAAAESGSTIEAIAALRRAATLRPDWAAALTELAMLLGAAADPRLLDADEAVRLAERAVALTGRRDADALDALGAAYAAQGRFNRAHEAVTWALEVSRNEAQQSALRERADLYRRGRPYRMPR